MLKACTRFKVCNASSLALVMNVMTVLFTINLATQNIDTVSQPA